jgi:hypothetical protein
MMGCEFFASAENRAEAKEQSLYWPLPCFQPWSALRLHSCRAVPSARLWHCTTPQSGNPRNYLRFRMTQFNVKEFGEEDSTLNYASFLSKNLDHLKTPPMNILALFNTFAKNRLS